MLNKYVYIVSKKCVILVVRYRLHVHNLLATTVHASIVMYSFFRVEPLLVLHCAQGRVPAWRSACIDRLKQLKHCVKNRSIINAPLSQNATPPRHLIGTIR